MPEPAATEGDLWHDLQPLLDQELSRLPDKYRVAIVLCDLEGKTRKEAARQLGVPEGTLAARVARGRAMLTKRLARHGPVLSGGLLATMLAQDAAAGVPAATIYAYPAGFPKGDTRFTSPKIIVARAFAPPGTTYANASLPFDPKESEHGTHVAGIAAGNHGTPAAGTVISGIAPRAYLGNYKALTVPTPQFGLDGEVVQQVDGGLHHEHGQVLEPLDLPEGGGNLVNRFQLL